MLICFEFEFSLYHFGGCRQFRVSAYPLGLPALMAERSTLNRRSTSLPEIDKF
jgi:hypothetical protein